MIAFYMSSHGFGHASRQIEIVKALLAARPDARIVVRTAVREELFADVRLNAAGSIAIERADTDTGLVQIDSLRFDEDESARQAAAFYARFDARVADEAARLRALRATLVVGDIPPLAFAAAHAAGVPSIAVGNFTWDWIYSIYDAFDRLAPAVMPAIRDAYALATRALRLPLHGGFDAMAAVTRDIPFVARRSTRDRADTRRRLGLAGGRPVVLPSFGAYGAPLPLAQLQASTRFTFVDPDRALPADLRYQDLVAAADVVVSKPGYGIVSECLANGTALLYTSRGRFIEYDLFVAEMPRFLRCRFISLEDLFAARWADAIDALVAQPAPQETPRIDGDRVAAQEIVALAGD